MLRTARTAVLGIVWFVCAMAALAGLAAPFMAWPNAARSIVDQTLHGHLGRPSVLPWAILLVVAAVFWVIAMGWIIDEVSHQHPADEQGWDDKRWWRPRGSWLFCVIVLACTAANLMLLHPSAPGPGARETGQYETMCDDTSDECQDQPVLEQYRWGKPFVSRAERDNIWQAAAWLVLWLPAGLLAVRLEKRYSFGRGLRGYGDEHPVWTMDGPG